MGRVIRMTIPTGNDGDIKKNIENQLIWDSRVDETGIRVKVEKGKVVLTGKVPSFIARLASEDDAWSVPGVISVENNIIIEIPSTGAIPDDKEIHERVTSILEWNKSIDTSNIEVIVSRGWVTLQGSIETYWKKIRVHELAGSVYGVIGITNNLAIVPTKKVSDIIIAETIVSALERNTMTDSGTISVEVKDGSVTLTGTVTSLAEAKAAREIAFYTEGVKEVHDNMILRHPEFVTGR
jgi:hyperosmotically inducible periplasmic protein